jgi:hypothetical protein
MARESTAFDQAMRGEQQRLQRIAEGPPRPAPGYDRDGMPSIDRLATYEQQARLRFSPRRLRWQDVQALDDEVGRLEQRRATLGNQLGELHAQLNTVDASDAARLAEWIHNGSTGARPEPERPTIENTIRDLEVESEAVAHLVAGALRKKSDYITKHRARLARLAHEYVEAEQAKALRLLDDLEATRDQLAAARELELWVAVFPDEAATRMPDNRPLCGALRQPLQRAGIDTRVEADRILAALRDDITWVAQMTTPEQRALLTGPDAPDLTGQAIWEATDEGRAAVRNHKAKLRESYAQHWGEPPSEY